MKLKTDNISHLLVDFDYSQFRDKKPPGDKSLTTLKEIRDLQQLPESKEFVVDNDNLIKVFAETAKDNNVKFPRKVVNILVEESKWVLLNLKNYFDRPRPKVLAESFGLTLNNVEMPSMNTPAYPSGHSAQAVLISKVLANMHPEVAEDFLKDAEDISYSRNIAKGHYKSDSDFGKEIGEAMYEHVKDKLF